MRWTKESEAQLKKLVDGGHTSTDIAKQMGRSLASVQNKRACMGMKSPPPKSTTVKDVRTDKSRIAALQKKLDETHEQLERERKRKAIGFGRGRIGSRKGSFCRVTFGDTHGCRVDKAAFAAFLSDLKVIQPKSIIGMGDHLDCDGFLSSHRAVGYTSLSDYSFAQDIDATNDQFDAIAKVVPSLPEFEYIEGNHEYRILSWCRDNSDNDSDLNYHKRNNMPQTVLSLEKRGINYYSRGEHHDGLRSRGSIKRDKCLYVHGSSHAANAARKHLEMYACNVVFGHTHRTEQLIKSTEATGPIAAYNPGCLCELQPMYCHSTPTTWCHGYGLQFITRSGFLHINIPIIDGVSYLQPLMKTIGIDK